MVAARSGVSDGFRIGLGFVLALVVIGILIFVLRGIFHSLPDPGAEQKAKLLTTRRMIDAYKTALGLYDLDNGLFPTQEQGLNALIARAGGATLPNWKGPYLDPPVLRPDPWGHPYIYRYPGQKITSGYDLFSAGPNGVEGDEDDIGNWQDDP